jgi:hypothetical protein
MSFQRAVEDPVVIIVSTRMLRERFDRRWVAIMCGLFVLYAVVRLALIAPDPSLTVSFSHASKQCKPIIIRTLYRK